MMKPVFELMNCSELAQDIGQNIKSARVAKKWRQEDLAKVSGASLQAIKNLEGGGNVELITFLRVTSALGMARSIWDGCKAQPQTLDELERMERSRDGKTRVRLKKKTPKGKMKPRGSVKRKS